MVTEFDGGEAGGAGDSGRSGWLRATLAIRNAKALRFACRWITLCDAAAPCPSRRDPALHFQIGRETDEARQSGQPSACRADAAPLDCFVEMSAGGSCRRPFSGGSPATVRQ
ncbi:hypothetical protein BGC_06900 [Burkholderia sp. 3C]